MKQRWYLLASVTMTVVTVVEADDHEEATELVRDREIEGVEGDGLMTEVWVVVVVSDGQFERLKFEVIAAAPGMKLVPPKPKWQWHMLASVTTRVLTVVEAANREEAIELGRRREIEGVQGNGHIENVWVVPDGQIDRLEFEVIVAKPAPQQDPWDSGESE